MHRYQSRLREGGWQIVDFGDRPAHNSVGKTIGCPFPAHAEATKDLARAMSDAHEARMREADSVQNSDVRRMAKWGSQEEQS
jgi:hypothetical protein